VATADGWALGDAAALADALDAGEEFAVGDVDPQPAIMIAATPAMTVSVFCDMESISFLGFY
jgi:hypothetical protein